MSHLAFKPTQTPWLYWYLGAKSCLLIPMTELHAQTPATPLSPLQSATERAEVEQVQATIQALLDALVDGGILTREKIDALVAAAKAKAKAAESSSTRVTSPASSTIEPFAGESQSAGAGLSGTLPVTNRPRVEEFDKDGKKIVRIPYVSEATKKELRDQVKGEVLAQAKKERWGDPGAYPSWLSQIQLHGDFRLREEATLLAHGNSPPSDYAKYQIPVGNFVRTVDIVNNKGAVVPVLNTGQKSDPAPSFNTQEDSNRMRLRARLGVGATVSEDVSVALRLSTGNTTDRTSTNQTMGQSFNKYTVVFDQAYLSIRPLGTGADFRGGRIPNPFFSTDLVWADDLGFEGVAVSGKQVFDDASEAFATVGYFPLSEFKPGTSRSKALVGLQGGVVMKLSDNRQLKIGLAAYNYQNVAGERETSVDVTALPDYAARYEYGAGFRQRGNTLFAVNAPLDNSPVSVYGLASDFHVLNLTTALDLPPLAGLPLTITADAVTNFAFSRDAIFNRTGFTLTDGRESGYLAKIALGPHVVRRKGEWNASLAYRYLGSDATLDAFTNSDFGLGGTNNQGFIVGGHYAIFDNTTLSARWMSSNQIDSYAPGSNPMTKLSVDTLQLDVAVRF
jgi:hypothetical protein